MCCDPKTASYAARTHTHTQKGEGDVKSWTSWDWLWWWIKCSSYGTCRYNIVGTRGLANWGIFVYFGIEFSPAIDMLCSTFVSDGQPASPRSNIYRRSFVIHTYTHSCIHTFIHTYIHSYIHSCIHALIHTYIYSFIHNQTCSFNFRHCSNNSPIIS